MELNSKTFQFVFSKEEEKQWVLDRRPWTFDGQLLVLVPWEEDVHLDDQKFLSTQMWVQAWDIPLQWLTSRTVWKIGRAFNQVSNVLIPENGSRDGRYAKLLVDMDLTKPLLRGTRIRCNEKCCWITFKYEQLPNYYFYCGQIGHGERNCGTKSKDVERSCVLEGQFGE